MATEAYPPDCKMRASVARFLNSYDTAEGLLIHRKFSCNLKNATTTRKFTPENCRTQLMLKSWAKV